MNNIKLIKKLRHSTGLGIMTCKKALNKYKGNIQLAINYLLTIHRLKSNVNFPKEGIIKIKVSHNLVLMLEINCETDFVSNDINFIRFVNKVANKSLYTNQTNIKTLVNDKLELDRKILIKKLNENIIVRKLILININKYINNTIGCYNHKNRICSLVLLTNCNLQIANDIAMHIIATNPNVIYIKDFTNEEIKKEKSYILSNIKKGIKPITIINKIIKTKFKKYFNENSLFNQYFIKDTKRTIYHYLSNNSTIISFFRLEI
ncbi:Elongation factor Ts [Candidatus Portiera aleyrodidarum]|uniref:Elongation factor Ts n=1 Tax=Candidatus Portiera aleyrodidarum TV TaxID=1297582 RepID=A0A8D3X8B8_9GAMM|nr:translation elongation factor Ts [Candidatus Portiera aleyrodidarum]AGI27021.1 translation elongation factor Ts (EF-Ts) [Candidatus Portiera aleyrodidarum TV]CEI58976.1 Elongation factor Ts [Candidatus Portiera aleyrodidarum]